MALRDWGALEDEDGGKPADAQIGGRGSSALAPLLPILPKIIFEAAK
jgi:hypothetical protein